MKYSKPVILNPAVVHGAKCGGGPCGRPKDGSSKKNFNSDQKLKSK